MSHTKNWLRATQVTGKFPEPKYNLTKYLQNVGDFVQTGVVSSEQYHKLRYAAYIWAYKHNCRVSVQAFRQLEGGYKVRVTLVNLHRERDFV